ncbi:MAG: thiamine-phosphate kinase [Gloeocapsa sp. UFS-A4-WI-NPMV-4B04]|jgi:thiamine-monophosphate kinase|nr:thiamine-phosphate kinase [Gloeocapsa sp. UFS-A4-WI-NPMV-4B04]
MCELKVGDIGEKELLKRLQRFCPLEIVGDDGAVMAIQPGQLLVVTTDVLVNEVHFSDRTTTPEDAGWRAAAANLSDLAAMGALPLGITVGLGLKSDVSVSWTERLYQGMTSCLQQYDTSIVGGDVCRSQVITLAITAFGQVHPSRVIRRSTAHVGDAIVVTGVHGASRAGLELLLHPEVGQNLSNAERAALILAHQRPQPRLDVLPLLWEVLGIKESLSRPSAPYYRVAGMDSSDGLADALVQICQASGVGAKIEQSQIPVPAALKNWVPSSPALEWALYGGEDFELVLCLPPDLATVLVQKLGNDAAIVGTITPNLEVQLSDKTGKNPDQVLTLSRGFQHF